MKTIYIDSEGVIGFIPDCPEEPKHNGYYPPHPLAWREYETALTAAKQSAVPFEDQLGITFTLGIIFQPDTIHPFPDQYEVEIKYDSPLGLIEDSPYATDKKVAVLSPVKKFSLQDESETFATDHTTMNEAVESQEELPLIQFHLWMKTEGWERHSSQGYWYKLEYQSQWPPKESNVCDVDSKLIAKFKESLKNK